MATFNGRDVGKDEGLKPSSSIVNNQTNATPSDPKPAAASNSFDFNFDAAP